MKIISLSKLTHLFFDLPAHIFSKGLLIVINFIAFMLLLFHTWQAKV